MGIKIRIGGLKLGTSGSSSWTPPSYLYYVDSFSGDDGNNGLSAITAWKTLTHADSVLTANTPIGLKYADNTWHQAPAIWHGLKAFFPMVAGADTSKVYDVANGLVGTIVGAVKYSGTLYPGISLESNGYVDLGIDALSIGTGDQTILATAFPVSPAAGPFVLFSNGAVAGQKGWALYTSGQGFGYQMRNTTTYISNSYACTIPAPHVVVSTIKRNNANGGKFFIDGVIKNSPGVATTSLGVQDLSPVKHTLIGARQATDYNNFCASLWIKELRVYNLELSEADAVAISTEATTSMNKNYAFSSGIYYSMGIDPSWYTSTHPHLGVSGNKEGPFFPLSQMKLIGSPRTGFGNAMVLALNTNKCNGTTPSNVGEINWLMLYQVPEAPNLYFGSYLATSHNGIDWNFIYELPNTAINVQFGDFFVDNDDPSDFHNIHIHLEGTSTGKIHEIHPLDATFTAWSDQVQIFDTGYIKLQNTCIVLVGSTYHMFYSISIALPSQTNYMHHAICTYGAFSAVNDWHNVDIGNYTGLGNMESMSFINLGGANWIMYYKGIGVGNEKYFYSLSNDNLATFSAGTEIKSLSAPLQMSANIMRMK
jgi:hypothetical protein